jgi:hypothetical protein
MAEASEKKYCCTTGGSLCYWFAVFAILYGVGLAAIYSLHLGKYQPVALFAALGLACVANFARNRSFHCVITGPFFLLVAAALALRIAGVWNVGTRFLWPVVLIVVGIAFLLERRCAS